MNKGLLVGGVVAVAVIAGVVITTSADSPIDVADGSIQLYFKDGFDVVSSTQIKAKKLLHHVVTIEVWDRNGLYDKIDVKKRAWTAASADGSLHVQPSSGVLQDEVPILASTTPINPVIAGDPHRFVYDNNGTRFTPATLSFTDGQPHPTCKNPVSTSTTTCTLTCPTGYCTVRIWLH
jgi:hypothetical protein